MKIGFIIYGSLDTLSGGYLYDRKLVEHLCAQGDEVEIISLPWRNYAAHLTDNFTFTLPKDLDILIQDELNHPSLIGANRQPHPYPIISLVHHLRCSELRPHWQNKFYRLVEKEYLHSVDGFIFNSQTTQNVVNEIMGHEKPFVVAHPPTDRFGERVTEEEIKIRAKQNPFRIIFLGNVMQRKGLHVLLNALQRASFNFQLDIIGSLTTEPTYANRIQNFIQANHLSSFIFLHGALDNTPLIEKLRQAHVLVVPSSYEGFGIVYLEGMGFGLPAIGTTAGAAPEVIENGKTGFLIPPEDSSVLAAHLTHLAENRDALVEMSVKALRRYRQQPKWEQTAKSIREFLHKNVGQDLSRP
jgi:glycosyltransferase involved in cell wall biosynthesis